MAASDAADTDNAAGAPGIAGISAASGLASASGLSAASASSRAALHAATVATALSAAAASTGGDDAKVSHDAAGISAASTNDGGDTAAALAQLGSSAPLSASTDTSATPTFRIHASVDSADFAQGLSDHVSWMVDNSLNGAKLQVNPPQLGPIELRISVTGDHAQVWMSTHSAVTRDALESSSPKLREMLGAQGFGQVSVDISQRSFQERANYSQPYDRASTVQRSAAVAAAPSGAVAGVTARASLGALDAYA